MIDEKWQKRWAEAKLFESDVDEKPKKFITVAFPYPNSPQHIGHARSYTTTDIYARFWRMKGYNVLYPMGFHVTGTPVLAMAKRIEEGDEELISIFKNIYGVSEDKIRSLTDPRALVLYFSREIEEGMRRMGFSIDWRRKFYTFDSDFNAFIQWQFRKLAEKGYLVKGSYPIAWCPKDNNALSAHDTKGDVDPELEITTAIAFRSPKGAFLISTYRPETIYGVTNLWINPDARYVVAEREGKRYILSKDAYESARLQLSLSAVEELEGDKLLSLRAVNPISGEEIEVLPASFVDPAFGTGVVMSVPSHAPYDYAALRDLGKEMLKQVIEIAGYSSAPAKDVVERLKIKSQKDPLLEKATEEIYKKEVHEGRMVVGEFAGMPVKEAREKVIELLKGMGAAFDYHVIANAPVYCRCGARAVVNILEDQWFINYGDEKWKEEVREWLREMTIIPEKMRQEYEYTVDWLDKRPTTRSRGLGTKFPFDESKVIDSLSDSTIYMAFYTIKPFLPEEISDEFFDYVLLGKGEGKPEWEEARKSFNYWYPCDSRHSGADLVRNHLTFYIFNHIAIFPKRYWPKQIVTNGFVLMEGAKMSKSLGNILPLRKALERYPADVIRFTVVSGADLDSDCDFSESVARGVQTRIEFFDRLVRTAEDGEAALMERWLESRLNRKIREAEELYKKVRLRHLALSIFYDVYTDLQWYLKRTEKPLLKSFFERWVRLIAPFIPHYAEEWWECLGKQPFVSTAPFPESGEVYERLEEAEDVVKTLYRDLEKLIDLTGKKPAKIAVFVASEWKRELYKKARELKDMKKLFAYAAEKGWEIKKFAKQLAKFMHSDKVILSEEEEFSHLKEAARFFEKELGAPVEVLREEESKEEKAKRALPSKPSVLFYN